jgi:hypothetical protein
VPIVPRGCRLRVEWWRHRHRWRPDRRVHPRWIASSRSTPRTSAS